MRRVPPSPAPFLPPSLLVVALLAALLVGAWRPDGAAAAADPVLRINGHPAGEGATVGTDEAALRGAATEGAWLVVRHGGGVSAAARAALAEAGCEELAFVPPDASVVRVVDAAAAAAGLAAARGRGAEVLRFEAAWKIDVALFADALAEDPAREVPFVVHGAGTLEELEAAVAALGVPVASRPAAASPYGHAPKARLGLRVAAAGLPTLADLLAASPAVLAVEPGGGARLLNNNANRIVQSGTTNGNAAGHPIWAQGLHGDGQVIAILDSGLDHDSCYFREADGSIPPLVNGTGVGTPAPARRKVIAYDFLYSGDFGAAPTSAFDNFGHGTWVAGNAAAASLGFETSFNVNNGLAPLARLVVQDGGFTTFDNCSDLAALGCPVIDLTDILEQAYAQGARFHNNSWGDRENFIPQNTYTAVCVDMDEIVWRRPDYLIVCAAGNSGPGNDTVGSPSTAKNVLSIAASGTPSSGQTPGREPDPERMQGFSSRGWASDGRIKPDLATPGVTRTSAHDNDTTSNNCTTTTVGGTSMASPVAAGAAALAREYFAKGWHPTGAPRAEDAFVPSAALLKATLIAGAHDMTGVTGAPPNRTEGWGRMRLERSLPFAGGARRLLVVDRAAEFAAAGGEPFELDLVVDAAGAAGATRIALVWTDPPASALATSALVNDLDLVVEDLETGTQYRGNVLDTTTGLSTAGGTADTVNNVEVAAFAPEAARRLRVRVAASRVAEGAQGFALAVSGTARVAAASSGVVAR